MSESFTIWVDRLVEGRVEKIAGSFDSKFLGVEEKELQFPLPVSVDGDAYLAEDHLVIRLKAKTRAKMPCAICNTMIDVELKVNFYHTEPIKEIKGAQFDWSEPLRETLLLELPRSTECDGKCPGRVSIAPYLSAQATVEEKKHFPFAGLE